MKGIGILYLDSLLSGDTAVGRFQWGGIVNVLLARFIGGPEGFVSGYLLVKMRAFLPDQVLDVVHGMLVGTASNPLDAFLETLPV